MIRIVGKRGKGSFESQLDEAAKGKEFVQIDCTSDNKDEVMRGVSPFYLGPVETYDGLQSVTFELAWQCAKLYPNSVIDDCVDANRHPAPGYFAWRDKFWAKRYPEDFPKKSDIRFPAGKGNAKKCIGSWWKVNGAFERLDYIPARKAIYIPVYAKAVVKTEAYRRLVELRDSGKNLMLIDFDGYNIHHPKYNFTYRDAIHCGILRMGHGFVLAMLLEGLIRVENGEVKYADGLMEPTNRYYSPDLRKLTDEAKLIRGAHEGGVTLEEWTALSSADRRLLKKAAKTENAHARGFTKAAWMRLPMAEKFAILRGTVPVGK